MPHKMRHGYGRMLIDFSASQRGGAERIGR